MCILTGCPAPLGNAMAMTAGVGLMAKHHFVDNVGPPLPVAVMLVTCCAACWYGVVTKKDKKAKGS